MPLKSQQERLALPAQSLPNGRGHLATHGNCNRNRALGPSQPCGIRAVGVGPRCCHKRSCGSSGVGCDMTVILCPHEVLPQHEALRQSLLQLSSPSWRLGFLPQGCGAGLTQHLTRTRDSTAAYESHAVIGLGRWPPPATCMAREGLTHPLSQVQISVPSQERVTVHLVGQARNPGLRLPPQPSRVQVLTTSLGPLIFLLIILGIHPLLSAPATRTAWPAALACALAVWSLPAARRSSSGHAVPHR